MINFRLKPVNAGNHMRTYRRWKQIIDEAIEILSTKQLTMTNLHTELNVNYQKTKQVIQELEERDLIKTTEKLSRSHKPCTYYFIPPDLLEKNL